jgi:hypothetical protein
MNPSGIEMIPGWVSSISGSLLMSGPTNTSPIELITPKSTPVTAPVVLNRFQVNTGVLLLDDGEEVPVARRKRPELRRLLGL